MEKAEHFDTAERQAHAIRFGMWVFIASEALFFAALFALYGAYRYQLSESFHRAIAHNHILIGTVNTIVLITSSLLVATAVHFLEAGSPRKGLTAWSASFFLGLSFLGLKATEYVLHFQHGILPGGRGEYFAQEARAPQAVFFNLYYLMTGLHAAHVLVGLILLAWAGSRLLGTMRRGETRPFPVATDAVGLYWHFVDIVWLFLWPLFYLTKGGTQ